MGSNTNRAWNTTDEKRFIKGISQHHPSLMSRNLKGTMLQKYIESWDRRVKHDDIDKEECINYAIGLLLKGSSRIG